MEAFASMTGHKGSLRLRSALRAFLVVYQPTKDAKIMLLFTSVCAAECQARGGCLMISMGWLAAECQAYMQ